MEERSVYQGEIAIIRSCASRKIPVERASIDFKLLLTEFMSGGTVLTPIHYDVNDLIRKERQLLMKCGDLAKKISDKKSKLRDMVDGPTFIHVFGFIERMIGYIKTDIGKAGTKISDNTYKTHETYKMIRSGWHHFMRDLSTSKPLQFNQEYEFKHGHNDEIFQSIHDSEFSSAEVTGCDKKESSDATSKRGSSEEMLVQEEMNGIDVPCVVKGPSNRRRRQRQSKKQRQKKIRELSRC